MFAVIKAGGRQYRVAADDVIKIDRLDGEVGDIVTIGNVLAHGSGDDATFGAPFVDGASIAAEIIEHGKAKTVIAFKKRRRQNSRRKRGHRQLLTTVRIAEILLDGAKPSKTKAEPKPAKVKAEAAAADEAVTEAKPAKAKAETKETKAETEAKAKAASKKDEPAVVAQPLFKAPAGEGDKLEDIKGIGPVAAGQLKEQGITTFAQLAKLTKADIETIDANMPFSADQIRDWQGQAKDLAKK